MPRIRWNRSAPRRWRSLNSAATARARRASGRSPLIARTWEYQRRGVLHLHLVLRAETPADRHSAAIYVQALDELRHRHGFGFVDRGNIDSARRGRRRLEQIAPERVAGYLAEYLAPRKGGKMRLTETVQREDVPPLVVYVSRDLTRRTGITMRNLRLKRAAWVICQRLGFDEADMGLDWSPTTWRMIVASNRSINAPPHPITA